MPDAMNFRHSITMATRSNQNNNKGKIQPNGKVYNKNCIQMNLSYRNNNAELYKLFHISVTCQREKERRHLLKRYTVQYT